MTQSPVTVTYPLEQVLTRIEQKLDQQYSELNHKIDNLQKDVNGIKITIAEVKTEVKNLSEDVKELKGSNQKQIWTLIGILVTAVAGFLVAVGRFVISGSP